MVSAVDGEVKITVSTIEGSKTSRLTCGSCDWMETAGSPSAATRKKNKHIAEHRSSTHGAPGVPTIMDAIEGEVEMPEGSFREAVPVVEDREPVPVAVVMKEFTELGEEHGPTGRYRLENPPEGVSIVVNCIVCGRPTLECLGNCITVTKPVTDVCLWCEEVHEGGPENCARPAGDPVTFSNLELHELAVVDHPLHVPKAPGAPKDAEERAKRLEMFPPHTRTEYSDEMGGTGPDYCAECSNELQDWVAWPCPYIAERQETKPDEPLPVVLTRARIEAQAGPSDADKDDPSSLWHEARAKAVSATLAAKLGSAADVAYIIEREVRERLNDARFRGNAYTRWGREREPFLEQVGLSRYNIVGEDRLFHARENPRHVCSPDGITIHPETGRVALGEYKTSGKELTLAKAKANGYIDQIQWQMYVMEADWAVLIWERRLGEKADYDTYIPEVGGEHIIMRDQGRIEELVRRADLFLDRLDHEQARMDEWTSSQSVPTDADRPLLHFLVQEHLEAKATVVRAEEALREYLDAEGIKTLENPEWKLSYSFGSARKAFDKERFQAEHPGVYEQYVVEGPPPERATLRVTPAKGEDQG